MSLISFEQAFLQWMDLVNECGIDKEDSPMMAESWNDYTDGLYQDGEFNSLMYHHCPAWDDGCGYDGEDTFEFLCEALNLHHIQVAEDIEQIREWLDSGDLTLAPQWVIDLETSVPSGSFEDLLEVYDDLV